MPVRATRIETPRRARPVIRPSRGPGPRPAPMYRPEPTAMIATPASIMAILTAS